MSKSPSRYPLDLYEIRAQLGRFLDLPDLIACSQVSKDWSADFIRQIWHTIDHLEHRTFQDIDSEIILEHGHLIRVVRQMDRGLEFCALDNPSVAHLRDLSMTLSEEQDTRTHAMNITRRNAGTLQTLELDGGDSIHCPADIDLVEVLIPKTAPYTSNLQKLTLERIDMTRESFVTILSGCPLLEYLHLYGCVFPSTGSVQTFKHDRITYLAASIERVILPDRSRQTESLFVHFPNLTEWRTWSIDDTLDNKTADNVRELIQEYCPGIRDITLPESPGFIVQKFLNRIFHKLDAICIEFKSISPEVLRDLELHSTSMTTLRTFMPKSTGPTAWSYENETVHELSDDFADGWMIQLLLTKCSRITVLSLAEHEMGMDAIEYFPWACSDLRELRINIRGLNTEELIVSAIKKWAWARRSGRGRGRGQVALLEDGPSNNVDDASNAIDDRVARHLLKFKKLTKVWLGYRIWTVPDLGAEP